MSVTDYTAKIKSISDSLGSINVNIDEEEMAQVCLGGLAQRFNPLRTAILARDTPPSFFNLQSMLLVEENQVQSKTYTMEGQMLFSDSDRRSKRKRSIRPIPRREFTIWARTRKPSRNLHKKGEFPCRTRSANDATYVQLLRQNQPSRRGVPKKTKRVGFNQPETHKLRRKRGVVKKTVHKRNRCTEAWEPALHARTLYVGHKRELGT